MMEVTFEEIMGQQTPGAGLELSFEDIVQEHPATQAEKKMPGVFSRIKDHIDHFDQWAMRTPYIEDVLKGSLSAGADIQSLATRPFSREAAEDIQHVGREMALPETEPGVVRRGLKGATRTLGPAIMAGTVGGPYAAIGYGALNEYNNALTDASDAGLEDWERQEYAVSKGAIEGAIAGFLQKIGLGGLESLAAGKFVAQNAVKTLSKEGLKQAGGRLLAETGEEMLTEGLQAQVDAGYIDPSSNDWTNPDGTLIAEDGTLSPMLQTMSDTAVQTLITMGAMEGVNVAAQRAAEKGSVSRSEYLKVFPERKGNVPDAEQRLRDVQELLSIAPADQSTTPTDEKSIPQLVTQPEAAEQAETVPVETETVPTAPETIPKPEKTVPETAPKRQFDLPPETVSKLRDAGYDDEYIDMLGANETAAENALQAAGVKPESPETTQFAEAPEDQRLDERREQLPTMPEAELREMQRVLPENDPLKPEVEGEIQRREEGFQLQREPAERPKRERFETPIGGQQEQLFPGDRPQESLAGQKEMFSVEDTIGQEESVSLPKTWQQAAKQRGLPKKDVQQAVEEVYGRRMSMWETMQPIRDLRKKHFHIIHRMRQKDHEAIRGWDEVADEFINNNPGFARDSDELAELMKSYPQEKPRKNDPSLIEAAFELLEGKSSVGAAQTEDPYQIPEGLGRPELANPATTPESRLTVAEIDEESGRPETRPDTEVEQAATQRLQDYDTEYSRLLEAAEQGEQLGDVDTLVAKKVADREAQRAFDEDSEEAILRAKKAVEAYRRTGTEQARAFRQRRDPMEGPQERQWWLRDAMLAGSQKHQDAENAAFDRLKNAKKTGSEQDVSAAQQELDKLREQWLVEFRRLKKNLKDLGFDVENVGETARDPVKAQRMMNQIEALQGGWSEKLHEYYKNAILSAITTTGADVLGSTGFGGYALLAERAAESLQTSFRKLRGKPKRSDAADWGEFREAFKGIGRGWREAIANTLVAMRTEKPVFQAKIDKDLTGRFSNLRTYIPGKGGRLVRAMGYTRLMMADEFFQTFIANMEVGAQARRILLAKGVKDGSPEMSQGIDAMVTDLQSEAWKQALTAARRATFQQQERTHGAEVAQQLGSKAQKIPVVGRFLFPFVYTPVNILEAGLQTSPIGIVGTIQKWNHARNTGDWSGVTKRTAQQMIAWGITMMLLASNDEEDPWITGSEGDDNYRKLEFARRGIPPQSVKIGGRWYSYQRVEPFATALSLTVDMTNAMRSGNIWRAITDIPESVLNTITNKSYLKSLGDMMWIVRSEDKAEGIGRWGSNFAASWVPNIIRHAGKNTTDSFPERGVWGEKGTTEWWGRLGLRTLQKTELPFMPDDQPKYDVWGREAPRSQSPIPHTDFVFRMMVPTHAKEDDVFIGDRVLMRWNMRNPDEEYLPNAPLRYYTKGGKKKYLDDEQYARRAKFTGEIAKRLVEQLDLDDENPTPEDVDAIRDAFNSARYVATDILMKEWEEGKTASLDSSEVAEYIKKKGVQSKSRTLARNKPTISDIRPQDIRKENPDIKTAPEMAKARRAKLQERLADWESDTQSAWQWFQERNVPLPDILKAYEGTQRANLNRRLQQLGVPGKELTSAYRKLRG